jgi:Raf kinase inhibitor-like YbhB/YbcL family protein
MPRRRSRRQLLSPPLVVSLVLAAAGCAPDPLEQPLPKAPPRITLESPEIAAGGELPEEITCMGKSKSPALEWSGVPAETAELVLIVLDLDAPEGQVPHWVLFGIPPHARGFEAGVGIPEARSAKNGFGRTGYFAPCPPRGDPAHDYVFTLYALRTRLQLPHGADLDDVLGGVKRSAIAEGRLTGSFER